MKTRPDRIFVFGSNLAGRHGKGAAQFALRYRGAIYGLGRGIQGDSYAIPTKDMYLNVLSLNDIRDNVNEFLEFAYVNPELEFEVTRIGTGLAGYRDYEIGRLFYNATENCILPINWEYYLKTNTFKRRNE